jgi:hypothetical protein
VTTKDAESVTSSMGFDRVGLEHAGFVGFVPVRALAQPGGLSVLPQDPGAYVLLRETLTAPRFVDPGTGGWFKGADPNVRVTVLAGNWVSDASVVYIGMASGLYERLGQLIKFGQGRNIGHKGGRYLWQLADAEDLLVAWQVHADPARRESDLLKTFAATYGVLPFANLRW